VAVDATVRAAASARPAGPLLPIRPEDVREKVRVGDAVCLFVFVVDASGSMGARARMVAAKGAVLSLLHTAYEKRDRVAFVAFRGEQAEVLLPPTRSVDRALACLRTLPTGGRTPLPAGVCRGLELVRSERLKNGNVIPVLVLVTDGRGNVPLRDDVLSDLAGCAREIRRRALRAVIIDAEHGQVRLGLAARLAADCSARYHRLDDLSPAGIARLARREAIRTE